LGETFLDASTRATVEASFVNSLAGGCVESVLTDAIHFLDLLPAIVTSNKQYRADILRCYTRECVLIRAAQGRLLPRAKTSRPSGTASENYKKAAFRDTALSALSIPSEGYIV
jgi:hypothetical protein